MKHFLILTACSVSLFIGCKGMVDVSCGDEPTRRSCVEACADDPTLSHCNPTDAGPDTGAPDGSVDAGPDAAMPCDELCMGDTPQCNTTTRQCVQCLTPPDCPDTGNATMCNDAGQCVQCLGDADCSEPGASVCATDGLMAGTCVGCTPGDNMGCMGVMDGEGTSLNICNDSAGSGVCVECNGDDETACGDFVCDVLAQTCTDDVMRGMTPTCGECVSNLQCRRGHTCAPTDLDGTDAGFFCLWDLGAPEMAPIACSMVRPFGTPDNVSTIGGQAAEVCTLRLSTCPAYNDFSGPGRGSPSCAGQDTPEADADCGHPDLDDGFCVMEDAASNLCTTRCTNDIDCVFGPLRDEYMCDMSTGLCSFILL